MIIGHATQTEELKKLFEEKTLGHGYIFFGPDLVGKKTVALHFANLLETGKFETPGILGDCLLLMPDQDGVIGIDSARKLKHFLSQRPNMSAYRTVIIDECHRLTEEAQNSLLKISEDTPRSGLIILVMRDPEMIIRTLSSRFNKIFFGPVYKSAISEWLVTTHRVPEREALKAASLSFGAPGRAYRMLFDKEFQKRMHDAEKFMGLARRARSSFIKSLISRDNFEIEQFLESLILKAYGRREKDFPLLRRFLNLRRKTAFYNVNARLQLEALLENT